MSALVGSESWLLRKAEEWLNGWFNSYHFSQLPQMLLSEPSRDASHKFVEASIPWAHPLDVKITINLPPLLDSENSFMQECCRAVSDRGIASDAEKRLPAVDLIAHPSRLKSLKSQLQIDRIAFRWRASDSVLGLAMMVVIYIMSVQLLSTFQRELKIKHSQGKVLLRAVKRRGAGSGEGGEVKCYILIKFPYNVM